MVTKMKGVTPWAQEQPDTATEKQLIVVQEVSGSRIHVVLFGWIVGRSDRGLHRHSYCLALAALADRLDGVNSCCWAALVNLNLIVVGDR